MYFNLVGIPRFKTNSHVYIQHRSLYGVLRKQERNPKVVCAGCTLKSIAENLEVGNPVSPSTILWPLNSLLFKSLPIYPFDSYLDTLTNPR